MDLTVSRVGTDKENNKMTPCAADHSLYASGRSPLALEYTPTGIYYPFMSVVPRPVKAVIPPRRCPAHFMDVGPTFRAISQVKRAFEKRVPVADTSCLDLLCARVCRGAGADAFDTLHPDGVDVKPWAWIVGSDGIAMLLEAFSSSTSRDDGGGVAAGLRRLGFADEWMAKKLRDGEQFRLALMPASEATPATWDGIFSLVRTSFPHAVFAKVARHRDALCSTPFHVIEESAKAGFLRGARYFDVNEQAVGGTSADPRYVDTARLASNACEGTLEEVRGFLYYVIGLNGLFDGQGLTKTHDGAPGVREFLMPNRRVLDTFSPSEFAWVPLPLRMADLEDTTAGNAVVVD